MTQLILDVGGVALTLPESKKGRYSCTLKYQSQDLTMASGRLVREVSGEYYEIKYQYGYLTAEEKGRFLTACETGWRQPIACSFLPPGGDTLQTASFLVTSFTFPKFMWSSDGVPMYGDYEVTLREVYPHA